MKELHKEFKDLTLSPSTRCNTANPQELVRAGSSPPKFTSSDLFLIQEDDRYTETFSHTFKRPVKFQTPDSTPTPPFKPIKKPAVTFAFHLHV